MLRPLGLFVVKSFHHTDAITAHARVLALSSRSWLVRRSHLMLLCNHPTGRTDPGLPSQWREAPAEWPKHGPRVWLDEARLLRLLADYPQRTRLLVHTDVDTGHECSELLLLGLSASVWARHPWVLCIPIRGSNPPHAEQPFIYCSRVWARCSARRVGPRHLSAA